jgi:hypothetical protein
MKEVPFSTLMGKVITEIKGLEKDGDEVTFKCIDGTSFSMYHEQDCCESVSIEDVCGDVADLLNTPILVAEESTKEGDTLGESETWTFYKLATIKGSVDIRWYGTSNGYYSESVSFFQTSSSKPVSVTRAQIGVM